MRSTVAPSTLHSSFCMSLQHNNIAIRSYHILTPMLSRNLRIVLALTASWLLSHLWFEVCTLTSCSFSLRPTILQWERPMIPWTWSHTQSCSISTLVRSSTIFLAVTWMNCLFWIGLASTKLLELNAAPPDCNDVTCNNNLTTLRHLFRMVAFLLIWNYL